MCDARCGKSLSDRRRGVEPVRRLIRPPGAVPENGRSALGVAHDRERACDESL